MLRALRETVDRGRGGRPRRGHRLRIPPGRHDLAGPQHRPGRTGPGRGCGTVRSGATAPSGSTPRRRASASTPPASRARPSTRTAPGCTRAASSTASPSRGAQARWPHRRGHQGHLHRPGCGADRGRSPGHGPARHPRDRGLDRRAAGPPPRDRPRLLAHGGHRAAPPDHVGRRSASPTARSSPTTGTSSSTASARPTTGSPSAAGARPTTGARGSGPSSTATRRVFDDLRATLTELLPQLEGVALHPRLGRPARDRPRLAPQRRPRRRDRARLGRWLRRRRRRGQQPRRPHPRRPGERTAHPPHRAALGRAPLTAVGARAAALARRQRRPAARTCPPTARRSAPAAPPRRARLLGALTGH